MKKIHKSPPQLVKKTDRVCDKMNAPVQCCEGVNPDVFKSAVTDEWWVYCPACINDGRKKVVGKTRADAIEKWNAKHLATKCAEQPIE